jgi:tetratricopeptide (TPR) repeat protein
VLAASLARSPEERHASFEDVHADLVQLVRDTVPRLRSAPAPGSGPPEREELLAAVTRARAEDRLEEALEGCRKLLELDPEDEAARRATAEIESVLLDREVDGLVGMALSYAADGEFTLATGIAEKVERLAPWSPRYLQLQVYLDEEGARRRADSLVATAREHLGAGRDWEARAAVADALAAMPSHFAALKLLEQLPPAPPPEATPEAPQEAPQEAMPVPTPVATPEAEPVATPHVGPEAAPKKEESPANPRVAEAVALSSAALRHFVQDEHEQARQAVERALALDPGNRRARELQKILRVLR